MKKKLKELFDKLLENRMRRAVALVLAIIVTFTTTYTLVLPAITLEKDTAETMSGINMSGNERNGDTSGSTEGKGSNDNSLDDSKADAVAFDAEAKNEDGETEALVHVEAGCDAFPEGTTLAASIVTDQDVIDSITEAVEGEVVAVRAVDLTFTDENGESVQPAEGSQVSVTLSHGEGDSSDTQNGVIDSVKLPEKRIEEVSADQNTETTVIQYTEDKGAEPVETNDDVSFQVEPENDLDQDNAVSFDMGEQSDDQESQTYAIVETVPDNSVKSLDFTDVERDKKETDPGASGDVTVTEDETVSETEENTQEENPDAVVDGVSVGAPAEEQSLPSEELFEIQEGILTAREESYLVTMTYGPEANIPVNAYLQVEEILESETYDTHLEETKKALNEAAQTDQRTEDRIYAGPAIEEEPQFVSLQSLTAESEEPEPAPVPEPEIVYARFFDITILDADGNEVTPDVPVKVSIELLDADQDEEVIQNADSAQVVHFGEDEIEVMEAEALEDTVAGVSFDTEGFSVYGVVYTVDFHWGEYTWSITGGSAITLSELFEILKIDADPADVVNVEFSNPELIWVGKVNEAAAVGELKEANGLEAEYSTDLTEEQIAEINAQSIEAEDWALISIRPFVSEETLTVTMKNGDQFVVKVTDAQIFTHVITADGKDFIITVSYGDNAQIPEGARLEAEEIIPETEEYETYIAEALEAIKREKDQQNPVDQTEEEDGQEDAGSMKLKEEEAFDITFARFFDIRIMDGEKKVEPSAPVKVTVTYSEPIEAVDSGEVCAVHFAENGIEVIDASSDKEKKEVVFAQGSFSVTGTIVTSNSSWPSSNGKYLMYVESGGNYYAVAHDGSLAPISVNSGKVTTDLSADIIDADYLWSYQAYNSGFPSFSNNYFVFYDNGSTDIYLDPERSSGINGDYAVRLSRNGRGYISNNNQYLGVQDGAITGMQQQSNAVPVQFASMPRTLTVHFVDREGNPITGVSYNGDSTYPVSENSDGTYSIPYNWEGTTGTISLENDFSKSGYTYGSSHLAGTREGTGLTYNGLTIDAQLTEKSNNLYFYSDCGDQYANPRGNLGYNKLAEYNINGAFSVPKEAVNETTNVGTINYSRSDTDKDIYVILDPVTSNASGSGGDNIDVQDPTFNKKLESNGDGTYKLSLSVTGTAKNAQENPKANVVFIIDTSSSMRKNVNNPNSNASPTRLEDTKTEAADFAQKLLSNNTEGDNEDKIEIAMITFDGSAVTSGTWHKTYNDGFVEEINHLIPQNMHTGTDWEDALDEAYRLGTEKMEDGDATYVVFFTDGEPSQYTNFNGTGEYTGQNRGYRYWYSCFLSRETANDEARAIVNSGMTLFSIFAYNPISDTYAATGENGSDMLHNLTKYAYDSTADLDGSRFFLAQSTTQLNNAFAKILNAINEYVGITDVEVNDSITSLTSVGLTTMNGNYTGFKYTRQGGRYGAEEQTWEDAPTATYDSSGVHWDLGNAVLEEGVTYKVSFTVWPSQTAYDWVADLNNGIRTWDQLVAAGLDSHFIRFPDDTKPSGYRYEVATNPPSRDSEGHIINNLITYTKTHRETVGNLPDGVVAGVPVEETDSITGTKTTTTYTKNPDETYTKVVVTEARDAFGPPDFNMDLDDTEFKIQKKWTVSRPEELIAFLYNTASGDLIEDNKNIDFKIRQGSAVYKTVTLGYNSDEDGFDWSGETQVKKVNGRDYTVGTIWEEPLDIAIGLMITPDKADEHKIDLNDPKYIPVYGSETSTEVLYYVLEKGHDYSIDEPSLDYRFDFHADDYHPMLVNKSPRDVEIEYKTVNGREIGILKKISPEGEKADTLTGENILRGELKIKKIVWDEDGAEDHSDEAEARVFPLTVTLTNEDAPFYNIPGDPHEQNVPWYGIESENEEFTLYYHKNNPDGSFSYYCNEHEACVDGDYTNGLKQGYEGNIMEETQDHMTATAIIYVHPWETWTITNIPGGTTYTIEENTSAVGGYVFEKAEEKDSDPANVVSGGIAEISGTIQSNHVTNVEFINRKLIAPIDITIIKTDVEHLNDAEPVHLPNAAFRLEKYKTSGYQELDETWNNGGKMTVSDVNGTGTFLVQELPRGFYKLIETEFPAGYVQTARDPIFEVRENTTSGILEIILLEMGQDGTVADVDGNNDGVVKIENRSVTVGNEPGAALPSAGGPGTNHLYLLGLTFTGFTGAGLLMRKNRSKTA